MYCEWKVHVCSFPAILFWKCCTCSVSNHVLCRRLLIQLNNQFLHTSFTSFHVCTKLALSVLWFSRVCVYFDLQYAAGIKKNKCPLQKNAKSYSITCTVIKEYSVTMNNNYEILCKKRRIGYQISIGFRTTNERTPKSYVFEV